MTTVTTSHPGKTVFQNSAIEITINDPFKVGTKETVLPFEPLVIDHLEGFEMIFHALLIRRVLRVAMAVYGFRHGVFAFWVKCIAPKLEQNLYRSKQARSKHHLLDKDHGPVTIEPVCFNLGVNLCH